MLEICDNPRAQMRGWNVGAGAAGNRLGAPGGRPDHGHTAVDHVDEMAAGTVAVVRVPCPVDKFFPGDRPRCRRLCRGGLNRQGLEEPQVVGEDEPTDGDGAPSEKGTSREAHRGTPVLSSFLGRGEPGTHSRHLASVLRELTKTCARGPELGPYGPYKTLGLGT